MTRIVKLEQLLPEDIAFEMPDGAIYLAPGDPPLQLILQIAELFERAGESDGADDEVGLDVLRRLDAEVLYLLRMRNPDLDQSPFGVIGVQHFVAELLKAYNFAVEGEALPPTKTRTTKGSGSKPRSKSSTGSRSS